MKRNMFGEAIAQPGDDLGSVLEENGIDGMSDLEVVEESLNNDPSCGWSCSLRTDECEEVQVHDFPDEPSLRLWLKERNVKGHDQ